MMKNKLLLLAALCATFISSTHLSAQKSTISIGYSTMPFQTAQLHGFSILYDYWIPNLHSSVGLVYDHAFSNQLRYEVSSVARQRFEYNYLGITYRYRLLNQSHIECLIGADAGINQVVFADRDKNSGVIVIDDQWFGNRENVLSSATFFNFQPAFSARYYITERFGIGAEARYRLTANRGTFQKSDVEGYQVSVLTHYHF
jgi:hypothetical protein